MNFLYIMVEGRLKREGGVDVRRKQISDTERKGTLQQFKIMNNRPDCFFKLILPTLECFMKRWMTFSQGWCKKKSCIGKEFGLLDGLVLNIPPSENLQFNETVGKIMYLLLKISPDKLMISFQILPWTSNLTFTNECNLVGTLFLLKS